MTEPLGAYTGTEPYLFVSYSHDDRNDVLGEIRWLQDEEFNVWYDTGIGAGTEWSEAIAQAIKGASHFVYFITPRSVATENCRRELNFAIEEKVSILAVHLEETDVPDGLRLNLNNRQALFRDIDPEYRINLARALGHSARPATPPPKRSSDRARLALSMLAFAAVALIAWQGLNQIQQPTLSYPPDLSVLVTPFNAVSDEQQSRADELTADLRGHLANYPELRTLEHNPTRLDDAQPPSYEIAGTLNRDGGLRVTLSRTADQRVFWSRDFAPSSSDGSTTRRAVASVVTPIARSQLVSDYECQLIRSKTRIREAADLLCSAQHKLRYGWIDDDLVIDPELVRPRIEKAIKLDPNVAIAYVLLADTYLWLANGRLVDPIEAGNLAHAELDKALAIEPKNPTIFATRASVQAAIDLDYTSGQRNAQRAISMDPLHPQANQFHVILADIALREGRLADALIHYRRAVRMSEMFNFHIYYARALNWAGESRETIRISNAGLDLLPIGIARLLLLDQRSRAEAALGDHELAAATLEDVISNMPPELRYVIAPMIARTGLLDEARMHAANLESTNNPAIATMVYLYAYLDDMDRGFYWLHKAIQKRDGYVLVALRNDQNFQVFREDARWQEVIRHLESEEAKGRERDYNQSAVALPSGRGSS